MSEERPLTTRSQKKEATQKHTKSRTEDKLGLSLLSRGSRVITGAIKIIRVTTIVTIIIRSARGIKGGGGTSNRGGRIARLRRGYRSFKYDSKLSLHITDRFGSVLLIDNRPRVFSPCRKQDPLKSEF